MRRRSHSAVIRPAPAQRGKQEAVSLSAFRLDERGLANAQEQPTFQNLQGSTLASLAFGDGLGSTFGVATPPELQ